MQKWIPNNNYTLYKEGETNISFLDIIPDQNTDI